MTPLHDLVLEIDAFLESNFTQPEFDEASVLALLTKLRASIAMLATSELGDIFILLAGEGVPEADRMDVLTTLFLDACRGDHPAITPERIQGALEQRNDP